MKAFVHCVCRLLADGQLPFKFLHGKAGHFQMHKAVSSKNYIIVVHGLHGVAQEMPQLLDGVLGLDGSACTPCGESFHNVGRPHVILQKPLRRCLAVGPWFRNLSALLNQT